MKGIGIPIFFFFFFIVVSGLYNEDYIHTPFGIRHKDCVLDVPSGSVVEEVVIDGAQHLHISHPSGNKLHKLCPHDVLNSQEKDEPIWNGYAEHYWFGTDYSYFTRPALASNVVSFSATWKVPATPAIVKPNPLSPWPYAPTLSYWIGLQSSSFLAVLQPVLEFNGLNSGGWDIASWNCCPAGYVPHSTSINVKTGDEVIGIMELESASNPYIFKITTAVGNHTTTLIANMTSQRVGYNWAQVKSEAYYVSQCPQLPAKNIDFIISNFSTSTGSISPSQLPWYRGFQCSNTDCPQPIFCNGAATQNENVVSIYFD